VPINDITWAVKFASVSPEYSGAAMKLPRRRFLHLAAGLRALRK
jgi:hypothetical protein